MQKCKGIVFKLIFINSHQFEVSIVLSCYRRLFALCVVLEKQKYTWSAGKRWLIILYFRILERLLSLGNILKNFKIWLTRFLEGYFSFLWACRGLEVQLQGESMSFLTSFWMLLLRIGLVVRAKSLCLSGNSFF